MRSRNPFVRRRSILRTGNVSSTSHMDHLSSASLTATKPQKVGHPQCAVEIADATGSGPPTVITYPMSGAGIDGAAFDNASMLDPA